MKKFIVHVDIGDLPPDRAQAHLKKVRKKIMKTGFFPKGCVLFIPNRGASMVETIEMD